MIMIANKNEATKALQKIENLTDKAFYLSGDDLAKIEDEIEEIGNAIETWSMIAFNTISA